MPIDPDALAASIKRLDSGPRSDIDPEELLHQIIDAAHALFNLSGVGLMFVDEAEALRYVAATDEAIRTLESAQEQVGEGPCFDTLVLGTVVTTSDLATDERYGTVASIVVPLGVRAVLGVPVQLGGAAVGALNVYRDRPHDWEDSEIAAVHVYARMIETMLETLLSARRHSRLADQLQYALDHRVDIERSIGYLMASRGVDAVTAFDLLRRAARSSRRKVGEIAADVLAGRDLRR